MVRLFLATVLVLPLALASGCQGNDCQQLCKEIANRWDECGISYDSSEVSDCRSEFRNTNSEEDSFDKYQTSCRQLMATTTNTDGQRVTQLEARFDCDAMRAGPGGAFGGS